MPSTMPTWPARSVDLQVENPQARNRIETSVHVGGCNTRSSSRKKGHGMHQILHHPYVLRLIWLRGPDGEKDIDNFCEAPSNGLVSCKIRACPRQLRE